MSMVTRCPECDTTFRVTPAHLRARDGYVRCGRCSQVFNALATLSALTGDVESVSHPSFEPPPGDFDFLTPEEREAEPSPWGVLSIIAASALALQIAYFFRAEIATHVPAAAPFLALMCAPFGCSIQPAVDPNDLAIADSDLRADPVRVDVVVLSVMLKNEGKQTRAYPALELTLTDAQNRSLARRVFMPREYAAKMARGLSPRSEVPLELTLEIGDPNAAGYRLYLFYP